MSSTPTVNTLINSSNCTVLGTSSTGTALTVQQKGAGNVVSFSNTSGTVGLFVSSTSNVGVGTGNPCKFQVDNGTGTGLNTFIQASGITAGQTTGFLLGKALSTYNCATMNWNHVGDGLGTNYLGIGAYANDSKLNITAAGSVGIGITNPGYTLTSAGTICGPYSSIPLLACYAQGSGNFTYANVISCAYINSRDSTQIFTPGNGGNGGAPVMTLQAGNYVGIGTTNPGYLLDLGNGDIRTQNGGNVAGAGGAINFGANAGYGPMAQIKGALDTAAGSVNDQGSVVFLTRPLEVSPYTVRTNLTERMRITAAGNVGIGTNNPGYTMTISGGVIGQNFEMRPGSTGGSCYGRIGNSPITDGSPNCLLFGADGGFPSGVAFLDTTQFGAAGTTPLAFRMNGSEKMRVHTNGYVGIGTTNPSYPLHVNGTAASASIAVKYINYPNVPTWTSVTAALNYSIYASGNILTSDAFILTSDERIKTEEQPLESYLAAVDSVPVKTFSYVDKVQYGFQKRVGFFAQEVEKVLPDAVTKVKDFIPNIFRKCEAEGNCVTITAHGLTDGTKIRIMSGQDKIESEIHVIDENTIQIDKTLDKDVFVFGTEVEDFRVLNYDYMSSVAFGGLKELHALVKTQQKTIEALESRLAAAGL